MVLHLVERAEHFAQLAVFAVLTLKSVKCMRLTAPIHEMLKNRVFVRRFAIWCSFIQASICFVLLLIMCTNNLNTRTHKHNHSRIVTESIEAFLILFSLPVCIRSEQLSAQLRKCLLVCRCVCVSDQQ